jgi:hypothetical protein
MRDPLAAVRHAIRSAVVCGTLFAGPGCRPAPPAPAEAPPHLSSAVPDEPAFDPDERGDEEKDRPFFNDFSWRAFIALNWPAADDRRGEPDPTKPFGDRAERVVWESWKSLDELYPNDPIATPPTAWGSYEAALAVTGVDRAETPAGRPAKRKPYPLPAEFGKDAGKRKLLQHTARLEDANQALLFGLSRGSLVAQNKTFVRFETRVNRVAYGYMTGNKYYLRERLDAATLDFPVETIHVKAAWIVFTDAPEDRARMGRFYRTTATVVADWAEDGTPRIESRVVGLVGLHIVHKTPHRLDWVWSTFEHADNLHDELEPDAPCASFSRTDFVGEENHPGPLLPRGKPFEKPDSPTQVRRLAGPIHPDTRAVDRKYREHPQVRDTVWANYKLVGTQWPRKNLPTRNTVEHPMNGENRLPPRLENVTLETFVQGSSCLSCHEAAHANMTSLPERGGFVFYPQIRAFAPPGSSE